MTDVVKQIKTQNSGGAFVYVPFASGTVNNTTTPEINTTVRCSGVNGVTDNGYLDTRFDEVDYYTA